MITRADYMSGKNTHDEYYGQFVSNDMKAMIIDKIGYDAIVNSTCPYFNDIKLDVWDSIGVPYKLIEKLKKCTGWHGVTVSERTSIKKANARDIRGF